MNDIHISSNGPQVSADISFGLKNTGSISTIASYYIDLMGFARGIDFSPTALGTNSCYHARHKDGNRLYETERDIKPLKGISIEVSTGSVDALWPWNQAYNGADFLVAIVCVSYTQGTGDMLGTSASAYVIGKKVDGKLAPLGEGDGLMMTKNLRWLSLHQDYKQ